MAQADYRLDGRDNLICCALDGEVRGYLPGDPGSMTRLLESRPVRGKRRVV